MSDELNVWRDANGAFSLGNPGRREQAAAAVIRDYGDRRDADAYQRGKLEGARDFSQKINIRYEFASGLDLQEISENLSAEMRGTGECVLLWVNRDDLDAFEIERAALDPAKIVGEG